MKRQAAIAVPRGAERERVETILTHWRIRLYARALLIPLALPLVIAVLSADGSSMITGRLGGDLPAFYGAGRIVEQGQTEQLYDWETQAQAEAGLFGDDEDVFQVFAYPPFVAHAYSALARLPYALAYAVHTALMCSAVAATVMILRRVLPRVDRWPLEAFAVALSFYPLYRAVTGGQNSAVTLLILAAVYWALSRERHVLAGLIGGLLLFKPQLALPVIGLLALKNWRSLGGVATTAAGYWLWGAWLGGAGWIGWWVENIETFNSVDQEVNGANSINLVGFAERFLGAGSVAAHAVGGVLAAATTVALMWVWWNRRVPLDLQMAAMVCGMLLIPLHVMFYDAGLLVLPFAVLANRHGRAGFKRLLGLVLLGFLGAFAVNIGFSTLAIATILAGLWIAHDIIAETGSGGETKWGDPALERESTTDFDRWTAGRPLAP